MNTSGSARLVQLLSSDRDRVAEVRKFLGSTSGRKLRTELAPQISQWAPVEVLVPEPYREWRPLVKDAMVFVFSRLSAARLAPKLVEQFDLPFDTPPAKRIFRLISKMPGIQKLGQVLARNRRLDPALSAALSDLENSLNDVDLPTVRAIIDKQLGHRLVEFAVEVEPEICCEASVSAVVKFTWLNPETRVREQGVFKVLKPYVPKFFSEDMQLLQRLSEHLTKDQTYGIGTREIPRMVADVRILLEHELDFPREQETLVEAFRTYWSVSGTRVPRPIPQLCTATITAMTFEQGVKVTEAFRDDKWRRRRIAEQLTQSLIAVPLLSREQNSIFHADPHAGNLLYDEGQRELVILDWALTENFNLESRRRLALLVIMTVLRDVQGVKDSIHLLASPESARDAVQMELVDRRTDEFFRGLPSDYSPGSLDAMRLLDGIAMEGVRFPTSLAMFRKVVFTLDGVLHDVAGSEVRMDSIIIREFILRALSSYGWYHAPLRLADVALVQRSALMFPARSLLAARSA